MRLIVIVLLLVALGGFQSAPAQSEHPGFVHVEVTLGKKKALHRFSVPVVPSGVTRKGVDDQFAGGGWGSTGACSDDIGCEGDIFLTADQLGKSEVSVWATLTFKLNGRKCEVTREFLLVEGTPAKRKMKCRSAKADLRMSF